MRISDTRLISEVSFVKAVKLRTEHMCDPIGIACDKPVLSWCCEDGLHQTAFQILAQSGGSVLWDSGIQKTHRMQCRFAGRVHSRQRVTWQVRLWDETGTPGPWSEEAFFELGITELAEWQAKWIDPEDKNAEVDWNDAINQKAYEAWKSRKKKEAFLPHLPASYMRKVFTTIPGAKNRLYITSKGIYKVLLNGKPVGNRVLAPGPAVYDQYIPVQTYDLDGMLIEGENELLVILGDGWYRSCSGVNGDRNLYGSQLGIICQVMADDAVVCATDDTWQASQQGPIRQNDLQQGEVYDARKETVTQWHGVSVLAERLDILRCDNGVPIVENEVFEGRVLTTPNGETVLDFGQNLAGFISIEATATVGQRIFLQCGETLDENGNFTQENFQDRNRHAENGTHQMVEYICKDGKNRYKTSFTIAGFRYAKLETEVSLDDLRTCAIAVYSQMERVGQFTCGHDLVNRLVENCVWSQKSNFCGIPTDCPTRERAGWTGDAGIFANAGLTLMDCYPVFSKWLQDCRHLQHKDGKVAMIAPVINRPGLMTNILAGSAGWGDASIFVPWAMYLQTGDIGILKANYPMMKRWYRYLEKRARSGKLRKLFKKKPWKKYLILSGLDYGEWCEPGVNNFQQMSKGNYDVATAYLSYSGALLSKIADILGLSEDAAHYATVSNGAKEAYCAAFTQNGEIHSNRQCQYVRPLQFKLLPEEAMHQAAADLANLARSNGYRLNTGFLSTPFLCKVLADFGYLEEAQQVLLQEQCPGWLYAVKKGATTVWENWDGINEVGKPTASLNHYSYGAIAGWLMQDVGGIHQEGQKITISPVVLPKLGYANAILHSPVGTIKSSWECQHDGQVKYTFTIPPNTQAVFRAPGMEEKHVEPGVYTIVLPEKV